MKLPQAEGNDRRLSELCQDVATICCSSEFKKLHKEISKIYRRNGLTDANRLAFQDSLFSIYLEQVYTEVKEEIPYP
ncbi:MAG TPA: hypothetical protein VJ824_13355 [Bacillota bacterium]|nr:hypothetical protein [Bacillota bacterium]